MTDLVAHYGLAEMPFRLTPDGRHFFESAGHARAVAHLVFGLEQAEGFIVVTGEVGAGKTTLIERLWSELDRSQFAVARIVTSQLDGDDLLRLVCRGFGAEAVGGKAVLVESLAERLRALRAGGRRAVLAVDEVQGLSPDALEELRMLSNLMEGHAPLLQTLLFGQPQFRRTLASADLDQLRQRVLASFHLGPLDAAETHGYVLHRLRGAGWSGRPGWDEACSARVHAHSGGVPRRINRLCARLLLYGALERAETITAAMVDRTAAELDADLAGGEPAAAAAPDLRERIDQLEDRLRRRETTFRRLMELLGA